MYWKRKWILKVAAVAAGVLSLSPLGYGQSISVRHQYSFFPADEARDLFNAGQRFYDQDKFSEAEKRFREVITRFPSNPIADRADYYLIRTLSQMGKQTEAISRIDAFPKNYPRSSWLNDVQEMRVRLTNQVPDGAEKRLRPPVRSVQINAQALPPSPPTPPSPAPFFTSVGPSPFPIEFQSSDPEISLQQEIMRAMFHNDAERAIQIATERLKVNPADPVVLSSLNVVATSRSPQALPMLIEIAKGSTNPKARRDAIFWLGQSRGDKDAIVDTLVGLLPSLTDDDSEAVSFALGQMRTDKALNALSTIARDKNRNEKLRNNALFWIGQSRAPNRVGMLEDIYKSNMDSSKVRLQVLFALSQTRDPQATTILSNIAQNDPDIEVKKQAIFWLGQSRSPEANQALERLLQKK